MLYRVGCVIVAADGITILGEGFHQRKGGPHAEAAALADARMRGVTAGQMAVATAYVTLEPCHRGPGKTTPPCDEALVSSGLRSVHIALLDPDPTFGNAGEAYLLNQHVRVTVGTAAQAVAASLRPYLYHRRTRMPWVVLKAAPSADGAIACSDGTSKWITGEPAREHAQFLRACSHAIMVGSGTAIADEPRLNVRLDDAVRAPSSPQNASRAQTVPCRHPTPTAPYCACCRSRLGGCPRLGRRALLFAWLGGRDAHLRLHTDRPS